MAKWNGPRHAPGEKPGGVQHRVMQALRGAGRSLGCAELCQITGAAPGSVREAASRLVALDKVERIGAGNRTAYRIPGMSPLDVFLALPAARAPERPQKRF